MGAIEEQMGKEGGHEAAALSLAKEYVQMYGEMGSKSNTMVFQEGAGNAQSLVVQALASMKAMNMGDAGTTAGAAGTVDAVAKEKPSSPTLLEKAAQAVK